VHGFDLAPRRSGPEIRQAAVARSGHSVGVVAPDYKLTAPQQKLAGWLSMGLALSIVPVTAIANLTKSWLFVVAWLGVCVVACAVMTAWVAHAGRMTFAQALVATLRRRRRSAQLPIGAGLCVARE
jgi:hypothetical protein